MMKHEETKHEVEDEAHEDCMELVDDLLSHVEENKYPEHIVDLIKGIQGELKEYEDSEDVEDDDSELEKKHWASVKEEK